MHVLHGALAGCGKTISTEQDLGGLYVWDNRTRLRRMLKKAVLFVLWFVWFIWFVSFI
jgi:hypothetical protein